MKLFFRTLAIVMAALLAVYAVGCGGDDDDDNGNGDAAEATFDGATPASDGMLAANQSITLKFTGSPGTITANVGTVSGRTINPPDGGFTLGPLTINITWENGPDGGEGSDSISYTVVEADETAPEVTMVDPENGAKDLDPAVVFEDTIKITFNEAIKSAEIMLLDDGDNVGWTLAIDKDNNNTVTLTGSANQTLSNETEYTIKGTATDHSDNTSDEFNFTFITKAKE